MRALLATALALISISAPAVASGGAVASVVVQDAYIDLHSGPGRGYPVTQVVERGGSVVLLRQRTDWIKVRTDRDYEGWVNRSQLERTLAPDGSAVRLAGPQPDGRTRHRWEVNIGAGDFDGADTITAGASFALTDSLFARADVSQLLGDYSNGWLGTVGIAHSFVPEWRVSPFVGIGGGVVYVDPNATLVQTSHRTNSTAYAGAGLRGYLTDRFLLQAEYREYVVFMDTNDNEVISEWTVGFTHYF
ncbi:MAG TPA: SH3 domain-containing protein [Mycobacterium sp.]|nr:SH3 domain-containing protein [Mycobacterium sp.]